MTTTKITREPVYKNDCWTCLKAQQDPTEKYTCPKLEQHWIDYDEWWIKKTYGE